MRGRDATTLRLLDLSVATVVITVVRVVRGGAGVCCLCCFAPAGAVVAIAVVIVRVWVWGTIRVQVVVVSGVVWGPVLGCETVVVCDAGRGTQSSWNEAQSDVGRECPTRERFCGGGPAPEVRDLVASICLSALGDAEHVAQLLEQDWVESWNGWAEMEADTRDVVAMAVAERFMRIAGANVPARVMSNRQRLQELEDEGLVLRVASPHSVNNCLIDALLLGLAATGVVSESVSMKERQALCAQCRNYLACQYSTPHGTYLDGHRDAPRILEFFLCQVWKADVSIRVCFYDCLDQGQVGEAGELLSSVDFTAGDRLIYERRMLHVYNHTDGTGRGYHFDALVRAGQSKENVGTAGVRTARTKTERVGESAGGALEPTNSPTLHLHGQTKDDKRAASIPAEEKGSRAPAVEEAQRLLQDFFSARGASVSISAWDAEEVVAVWHRSEDLAEKLHTLLQAGLPHSDSGMHAARRLLAQWRAYCLVRTQGPAQRLGSEVEAIELPTTHAGQVCVKEKKQSAAAEGREPQRKPSHKHGVDMTSKSKKRKETDPSENCRRAVPVKRLRRKTPAAEAMGFEANAEVAEGVPYVEAEDFFVLRCDSADKGDPRRGKEGRVLALSKHVSLKPTLPWQLQSLGSKKEAYDLPAFHCSFKECDCATENEEELRDHVTIHHAPLFAEIGRERQSREDLLQMYADPITRQCQSGAPVANVAIDRRALRGYRSSVAGDSVACLLCFVCARKYPYVKASSNQEIGWVQPVNKKNQTLCGQSLALVDSVLGFGAFKEKYVDTATAFAQQEMKEELESWSCEVQCLGEGVTLVCCPEDKACQKQPAAALSNDMMVYYGPRDVYSTEITVMEMLCASPCLTTMICFSLEQRLRGDRALDQDAWRNRQRMACRGNATTFPLAWEDLLQQLKGLKEKSMGQQSEEVVLPHSGRRLSEIVSVIVKSHQKQGTVDAGRILHQARVRRAMVVKLIEDGVARGHPAFEGVNMQAMYSAAEALPEDGIPLEVMAELPYDSDLDRIVRQKAATPVRQDMAGEELAEEMRHMAKPNAVVGERTSLGMADVNAQHVSALQATAAQSQGDSMVDQAEFVLQTGNKLLDQFRPEYFGFAFPYVFKFCTGMPDPPVWSQTDRYRRDKDAPRVELQEWVQIMARRCEAQIGRDWVFGFAAWNLYFRSGLNLARNIALFSGPVLDEDKGTWRTLAAKDVEQGAVQLLKALQGTYVTQGGKPKAVNGDISKLPYVRGLTPAARKLVQNMRNTAQSMPGTQEARKRMRFEIEALRIKFGTPIFVTFSPDEAHQMLYLRLSRTRGSDPVRGAAAGEHPDAGEIDYPAFGEGHTLPIDVRNFCKGLPTWEQRRKTLAREPLASVDGFRVLVLLVMEHLFGLHVCGACPDCNLATSPYSPCQDESGSNATLMGGVFGRMDAAYVTIEAQKSSGSLRAHCQCFVQCLHQHTPLEEIFACGAERLTYLRSSYLRYSRHVMYGVYAGHSREDVEAKIAAAEATWPEHRDEIRMVQFPTYQGRRARDTAGTAKEEAEAWAKTYLEDDVAGLQFLKQHHYHPVNPDSGEEVPLHGCQKADRPGVCKSEYPRDAWVTEQGVVLCPCRATAHGMATHGRKNRIGSMHGPYGNEWLNYCHPSDPGSTAGSKCGRATAVSAAVRMS